MYKFSNFFKDEQGKVVIGQPPNSPLIGWLIFTFLNIILGSNYPKLHHLFSILSFGFIFTWAWLEITSGVNGFRRTIGLLVLIIAVWFYLKV